MDNTDSYLDHAATSFPRPPEVLNQMLTRFAAMGCSPGRGGYDMAMETEAFVQKVRRRLASFFGAESPDRVVFAANATDALNLAIMGLTRPGTHVVSTRLEHNSVLRPLFHLKQTGKIDYTLVGFDKHGFVNSVQIAAALRPNTGLVVVNHASNVLGTIQPIDAIGRVCAEQGIPLLIDVAQSAGHIPIHMTAWNVSALAFTGHKALLGPTGIGGLITAPDLDIAPTRFGGTGVDSHSLTQPLAFPQRLEAGTLNVLGIMGLNAGLDYLEKIGLQKNHRRKMDLLIHLYQQLSSMDRVRVYGSYPDDRYVPVLSFNIQDISPQDVGSILDGDYGIAIRAGLHCAPLVHEDIGTSPQGAVRVSMGWNTTEADINRLLAAVADMATKA